MDNKRGCEETSNFISESKKLKICNEENIKEKCFINGNSIADSTDIEDNAKRSIHETANSTHNNLEEAKPTNGSQKACVRKITIVEADVAEDKGSRNTMEDTWVVQMDGSIGSAGKLRCHHFAIYDGHGGRRAAEYARAHLHQNVLACGLPCELIDIKAAKKAIIDGFRRTDEHLLKESATGSWQDGATAVSVWILGETALIANIGDAKAVVARSVLSDGIKNPESSNCLTKAIVVTREHKAIYPQERARIEKAGGYIAANGRLQGRLEVSRAFGDRQFKKVGVSAVPDVHSFEITGREKFMILGCDGLWGVFGPSDAVDFIDKQLKDGSTVSAACRRLVREAVLERHCKDNCTAIVILFKHE